MDTGAYCRWGDSGIGAGDNRCAPHKIVIINGRCRKPVVSTLELVGSIMTALLAILVPVLCIILIGFLGIFVISKASRFILRRLKLTWL